MKFKTIRRIVYFLVFCLILAALMMGFYKPIILAASQKYLHKAFTGSAVSIERCRFSRFRKLSFFNVAVQKDKVYDFKAERIDVHFKLSSILEGKISQIVLSHSNVDIDFPQKSIVEIGDYLQQNPRGKSLVSGLILKDMNFNLKSKEINIDALISANLNLTDQSVSSMALDVISIDSNGIIIKDALLSLNSRQDRGKLTIGSIKYNKAEVKELKGIVHAKGANLFLDFLSGKAFGGRFEGNASLRLDANLQYFAELKIRNMRIERIISDLELDEKIQMDGKLSGAFIVRGTGADRQVLSGDLATGQSGGTLVIKDTRFLENIARGSNQPVDLLVDNLRDYHYNTGTIHLSLVEDGLNLDMALDGDTGKRNLNILLHNFGSVKDFMKNTNW